MALGVMSAGIGAGPAPSRPTSTSRQGNRVDEALYDRPLPPLRSFASRGAPHWDQIVQRADGAPADIVPGLLGLDPDRARDPVRGGPAAGLAALMAASIARQPSRRGRSGAALTVFVRRGSASSAKLATGHAAGDELLIALRGAAAGRADAAPDRDRRAAASTANLTSDSTRTDGYVALHRHRADDPERLGVPVPDEMDGEPIRSEGERRPRRRSRIWPTRMAVDPEPPRARS